MLRIEDLKRRRNEWIEDSATYIMLDAADCVHRVAKTWDRFGNVTGWIVAWIFIDIPFGLPNVSHSTFETAEKAMEWVDVSFSEHFEWFEAAA